MTGQYAMCNGTDDDNLNIESIRITEIHVSDGTKDAEQSCIPIVNEYFVQEVESEDEGFIIHKQWCHQRQEDDDELDHHTWTGTKFVPDYQHRLNEQKRRISGSDQTTSKHRYRTDKVTTTISTHISQKRKLSRNLSNFENRSKSPLLGKSR